MRQGERRERVIGSAFLREKMEVTRPREVHAAERDSQARLDVRACSSSQKLEGNEVLPSSLHNAADAGDGQEEEGDWNVHARGRHDFFELDHENPPSFDAPAHLLGSAHCSESPNTLSRQHESCFTPVSHETARSQVSEEEMANVLDATSLEGDNANDETSPDVSNEEKSTSAALDADATKKRKLCATPGSSTNGHGQSDTVMKKARKRPVNVWAKSSSRKGAKRSKNGLQSNPKNGMHENIVKEDCVYLTPASKHQDKIEDGPDTPVVLSKFHKAEKIELSDDRLSASNTKGYRMVRATRGVNDGAWYFEIMVEKLGKSGHTRLGWSTEKGEIQAPVGFDNYSYAYRDVDGSKVHMAVRERYGEPYVEGDVIGFYINLPNGAELAPKPASLVSYRGQPYVLDEKEDPPKIVPGSEIAFFRNGKLQGTAFKDLSAGRYFPAASMYTLPDEPKCVVKFHFGPDFRFPPKDIGERPMPQPIACALHCGMATLGFGSMDWKSEPSGVNPTHTLEPQKTGEMILDNLSPLTWAVCQESEFASKALWTDEKVRCKFLSRFQLKAPPLGSPTHRESDLED